MFFAAPVAALGAPALPRSTTAGIASALNAAAIEPAIACSGRDCAAAADASGADEAAAGAADAAGAAVALPAGFFAGEEAAGPAEDEAGAASFFAEVAAALADEDEDEDDAGACPLTIFAIWSMLMPAAMH